MYSLAATCINDQDPTWWTRVVGATMWFSATVAGKIMKPPTGLRTAVLQMRKRWQEVVSLRLWPLRTDGGVFYVETTIILAKTAQSCGVPIKTPVDDRDWEVAKISTFLICCYKPRHCLPLDHLFVAVSDTARGELKVWDSSSSSWSNLNAHTVRFSPRHCFSQAQAICGCSAVWAEHPRD